MAHTQITQISGVPFARKLILVGRAAFILNMYTAPHALKHAEGFRAKGFLSGKVCLSFVA